MPTVREEIKRRHEFAKHTIKEMENLKQILNCQPGYDDTLKYSNQIIAVSKEILKKNEI